MRFILAAKLEAPNLKKSQEHLSMKSSGRLVALDLGTRRVGVAVSDELCLSIRPIPSLQRTNWKRLVREVSDLVQRFDARGLVIGLPLMMDGSEGSAAQEARRLARNFQLTLKLPVFLQDERLTSLAAEEKLKENGIDVQLLKERIDSEAASLILRDFISHQSATRMEDAAEGDSGK